MKVLISFGKVGSYLTDPPEPALRGSFLCDSAAKAAELASHIAHVFMGRTLIENDTAFLLRRDQPRVSLTSVDRTTWIEVQLV